ncbi:unnamed protein product [Prorocentrum cordatum]|uniref:Uncharacterized protein n=1 Tax=Prorocentrum cordatum TaxID=2364126 RepID=A0ABN9RKU4_9DINO|nr:unnamed protein product [Polarella glacialis]
MFVTAAFQQECDIFVPRYLRQGALVFTDGAGPYEAPRGRRRQVFPRALPQGCLGRAKAIGKDACSGWRLRAGRTSFSRIFWRKKLSRGVMTHSKDEWCVVNSIRLHSASGTSRVVKLKHGTGCVDGCWSEMKQAIPQSLKSVEHDKMALYVKSWAWRTRRQGDNCLRTSPRNVK